MQLNNENKVIIAFAMWFFVEILSLLLFVCRRVRYNRISAARRLYTEKLLDVIIIREDSAELIRELYFCFASSPVLRPILYEALRREENGKDGLLYIYRKLGSEPIRILHQSIRERIFISKNFMGKIHEVIDEWNIIEEENRKLLSKNKYKLMFEKYGLMYLSFKLYDYLRLPISLWIFIVVNTIGVIVFIILEYESVGVDTNISARNPARDLKQKNKAHIPARKLQGLYQLAGGMGLIINISIIVTAWLW